MLLNSLSCTQWTNPDALFRWDAETVKHLNKAIEHLAHYGNQLKVKRIAKGSYAKDIAEQLGVLVSDQYKRGFPHRDWKENLKILKFKLQFKDILHRKDKELNEYRSWNRFVVNVMSFLLTGCFANLIYLGITGGKNFLFFNEVKTTNLVNDIDKNLMGSPTC